MQQENSTNQKILLTALFLAIYALTMRALSASTAPLGIPRNGVLQRGVAFRAVRRR